MDLVNKFRRIIPLLIPKNGILRNRTYVFCYLFTRLAIKLDENWGNRSGLILIRSGGFCVNPGPSHPSPKSKFAQIWAAGADGLTRRLLGDL